MGINSEGYKGPSRGGRQAQKRFRQGKALLLHRPDGLVIHLKTALGQGILQDINHLKTPFDMVQHTWAAVADVAVFTVFGDGNRVFQRVD